MVARRLLARGLVVEVMLPSPLLTLAVLLTTRPPRVRYGLVRGMTKGGEGAGLVLKRKMEGKSGWSKVSMTRSQVACGRKYLAYTPQFR